MTEHDLTLANMQATLDLSEQKHPKCHYCEYPNPGDHLTRFMLKKCEVARVCERHLHLVSKDKRIKEQPAKPTTQANQQAMW